MKFPIPDDWDGITYCDFAVCWPDSEEWRGLLRGFLTLPMRGRTWDEKTGSILDVQAVGRDIAAKNLDLRGCLVACNDTAIAEALNAIAEAIASQSGSSASATVNVSGSTEADCSGCGGESVNVQQHVVLNDGSTWIQFGTVPVPPLPPSGFPEGYPDIGAYNSDKCAKATKMCDDWIASLNNLGTTSWVAGVLGAAAILAALVGLITVPPTVIPLLLFALTANVGINAAIIQLANLLEDNREEVICILFTSDSVDQIIVSMSELVGSLVVIINPTAGIARFLAAIALWLLNSDTLAYLFSDAAINAYPDADCSACVGCEDVVNTFDAGMEGWAAVTAFPSCFGLSNPPLGTVGASGGILTLTGVASGSVFAGGMRKVFPSVPLNLPRNISAILRHSAATVGIYIDVVIVTDTDCLWGTMSNSFASTSFVGLGFDITSLGGSTIEEIFIYCNSTGAGTELHVEFEEIGIFCGLSG